MRWVGVCVFPYAGTSRIRFAGQGLPPYLSRIAGSPKTGLECAE